MKFKVIITETAKVDIEAIGNSGNKALRGNLKSFFRIV